MSASGTEPSSMTTVLAGTISSTAAATAASRVGFEARSKSADILMARWIFARAASTLPLRASAGATISPDKVHGAGRVALLPGEGDQDVTLGDRVGLPGERLEGRVRGGLHATGRDVDHPVEDEVTR